MRQVHLGLCCLRLLRDSGMQTQQGSQNAEHRNYKFSDCVKLVLSLNHFPTSKICKPLASVSDRHPKARKLKSASRQMCCLPIHSPVNIQEIELKQLQLPSARKSSRCMQASEKQADDAVVCVATAGFVSLNIEDQ